MSLSTTIKSIQDIMRKDAGVDGDAQRIGQLGWMLFFKIFSDLEIETELEDDDYESPVPPHLRWNAWANEDLVGTEAPTGDDLLELVDGSLFPIFKDLNVAQFTGKARQRAELLRSVFEDAYNYMKSGTLMRQVINKINHDIDFNQSKTRHLFGDIYEQILRDLQGAGNAGEFYTPRAATQFAVDMVAPRLGETVLDPACGTGGFLTAAFEHMRTQADTSEQLADLKASIRGVEKKALPHLLGTTNLMLHGVEVPQVRHGNTLARPLRDYGPKDQVDVIVTNPPFGGMEEDGIENNFPAEFRTRETADLFLVLVMELLRDGGRAAIVLPDGTLFGEGIKTRIKKRLLEECNLHTIVRLPKGVFAPYTTIKTNILFFTKGEPTKDVWFYEHPYPEGYKSYSKTKRMRIEEFGPEKAWWESREETELAWKVTAEDIAAGGYNLDITNPSVVDDGHEDPDILLARYEEATAEVESAREALRSALARSPAAVVDAQTFLDNFATIADAPGGVPRLRDLVLSLAVTGRLVPHDTDAGAADRLILEASDFRSDLVKRGLVPKPRALTADDDPSPFTLPDTWTWTDLDSISVYIQRGKSPKYAAAPTSTPVVSQKCVQWSGFDLGPARYVVEDSLSGYGPERFLQPGDLLWNSTGTGTVGRVIVVPDGLPVDRMVADSHVTVIRLANSHPQFVRAWLASTFVQSRIEELTSGTTQQQELNTSTVRCLGLPVPPRPEQERIVAKVDELICLCGDLESALARRSEAAAQLARVLTARMASTEFTV